MTPEENVAYLKAIRDKVATVGPPCAKAMGDVHYRHLRNVTLIQSGVHGPADDAGYPPAAAPGRPPMLMTGTLRSSVTVVQGPGGGPVGSSIVGPHTVYAATQEYGGTHTGDMWLWVRFVGPQTVLRKNWRKRAVHIHEHPYMRPSRDAVVADGSVTNAGNAVFMQIVWGL